MTGNRLHDYLDHMKTVTTICVDLWPTLPSPPVVP